MYAHVYTGNSSCLAADEYGSRLCHGVSACHYTFRVRSAFREVEMRLRHTTLTGAALYSEVAKNDFANIS